MKVTIPSFCLLLPSVIGLKVIHKIRRFPEEIIFAFQKNYGFIFSANGTVFEFFRALDCYFTSEYSGVLFIVV